MAGMIGTCRWICLAALVLMIVCVGFLAGAAASRLRFKIANHQVSEDLFWCKSGDEDDTWDALLPDENWPP